MRNIGQERIGLIQVPVPPAAEQERVVAKLEDLLSDLDAGVAELKAAQQKLQRYRQSLLKAAVEGTLTAEWRKKNPPTETGAELLQRILRERRARWEEQQLAKFAAQGKAPPKDWKDKYPEPQPPKTEGLPALPEGWVWASLEQLSHFARNGLSTTPNTEGVGLPLLKINAVRPMSVNIAAIKHLEAREQDVADYFVEPGDLLVTRYNGSLDLLGVFGLVRDENSRVLHPDKLIRVKPVLVSTLGPWIEIAANTGNSRAHIVSRVKTTAGQTGISGDDLKKMPVPLPPLREQDWGVAMFHDALAGLARQLDAIDHTLAQSSAQRQNILRAAFRGELVPQDPNDEPASVLLERLRAERSTTAKPTKAEHKTRKAARVA